MEHLEMATHRWCFLTALAAGWTMLGVCGIAAAGTPTSITVPNYSFESHVVSDGSYTTVPSSNNCLQIINPLDAQFSGATGSPGTLPSPADGSQCMFNNATVANSDVAFVMGGTANYSFATLEAHKKYVITSAVGSPADGVLFGNFALILTDYTAGGVTIGPTRGMPWSPAASA
jgi:hypothetical protein